MSSRIGAAEWLVLVCAALPLTAFGEGKLLRSQPAENAVLSESPKKVETWFSDGVVGKLISLAVIDSTGHRVDEHYVQQGFLNKDYVYASLKPLAAGAYTVRYRVVVAGEEDEGEDESVVSGKFKFSVK